MENIPPSSSEKTAFIQSWLFFGVLIEMFAILDILPKIHDFFLWRDGIRYLSLRALKMYISQWDVLERCSTATVRDRRQANIDELLELADIYAQENLRRFKRYESTWLLSPESALSIQLLHEALRHAWGVIYIGIDKLVTICGAGLQSDLPDARMRAAGWCPSEIAMLHDRFSVTGRYFASRLHRRGRRMNHADCSETICYASQINDSTYVTQHVTVGCRCAHITVDPLEVGSILKQGKIPRVLIRPCSQLTDQLTLQIVDSGPYTAISHVWAHGLGNAQSNSLPLCQLRRIQEYVGRLCEVTNTSQMRCSMAIWIDTLGVPLVRETRKLALKLLPRTYSESTFCLVIDEELRETSSGSPLEELCLRFVISTWTRRLWTFQEGIVTWDKLYLQLKEGPMSFGTLRGKQRDFQCHSLRLETIQEAKSILPRVEDQLGVV